MCVYFSSSTVVLQRKQHFSKSVNVYLVLRLFSSFFNLSLFSLILQKRKRFLLFFSWMIEEREKIEVEIFVKRMKRFGAKGTDEASSFSYFHISSFFVG